MQRTLLLLPVLILSCKQQATQTPQEVASATVNGTQAVPIPFTLISGNINSDSAVFEAAGITAAIANSGTGMQTIHITREGKRLINYMRAIDSTATAMPVPQLIITGTDTVVELSTVPAATRNIFFKIKNNRATYTKTGNSSKETAPDTIKKDPANAGAL